MVYRFMDNINGKSEAAVRSEHSDPHVSLILSQDATCDSSRPMWLAALSPGEGGKPGVTRADTETGNKI